MGELADFVLGYYRLNGALVEAPRYGVQEVLLPDELAAQLDAPAFQRLVFDEASQADQLQLAIGHPLVDRIVERVRQRPAPSQVYINTVRLDKRGLAGLARQALAFPNARLVEAPRQTEARILCHYVRFTFKVTLTTDEKQEHLACVTMDAQAGWPVDFEAIQAQAALDETPGFANLSPARPRWIKAEQPLAPEVLAGLLERAQRASLDQAAGPIDSLRRRAARYLELDRARLEQYYDDTARDLERRIQQAGPDRQAALQDKLAAVQAERLSKLADAEARYRLRVDLELITAQVIVQPKLALVVQIENRTAAVQRYVVWDPLLHCIEPLRCDVCGQPGQRLHLCTGGHLAHAGCLLDQQCVDCKRVYCQLCQTHMSTCVVCGRAVCIKSLNKCSQCGRGTCQQHTGLCHADNGQPARLAAPEPEAAALDQAAPAPEEKRPEAPPAPARQRPPQKPAGPRVSAAVRRARQRAKQQPAAVKNELVVQIEPDEPLVTAYVATPKGRSLAVRSWILSPAGILVKCSCEKGPGCLANNILIKPQSAQAIDAQLKAAIEAFGQEYRIPRQHITYLTLVRGVPTPIHDLVLPGSWKDALALVQATSGWQAEYKRQHPPWPADLLSTRRERAYSLPDLTPGQRDEAEQVVKVAYGLLVYEGVLKKEELYTLVIELAHPGEWCTLEHFEALLRFNHFKVLVNSLVATHHVRNVHATAKRKAKQSAPARTYSLQEVLAASEPYPPLSELEARLESQLQQVTGRRVHLPAIQHIARNAASPAEFVSQALDEYLPPDEEAMSQLAALLAEVWNHTTRYELHGRTPAQVRQL